MEQSIRYSYVFLYPKKQSNVGVKCEYDHAGVRALIHRKIEACNNLLGSTTVVSPRNLILIKRAGNFIMFRYTGQLIVASMQIRLLVLLIGGSMEDVDDNLNNQHAPLINHRRQRYRVEWKDRVEYRDWLRSVVGNDNRARCTFCVVEFTARLYVIDRHKETLTHQRNVNARQRNNEEVHDIENQRHIDHNELVRRKVQVASIKLSAIFAEHNLAFLLANHLIPVLKDISFDVDSREIWDHLSLDQKDVRRIITDCIAQSFKTELIMKLRNCKFIVQFDETTDVSQVQNACIVVKYVDFERNEIIVTLWGIIPVFDEDDENNVANAQHLYDKIINNFLAGILLSTILPLSVQTTAAQ